MKKNLPLIYKKGGAKPISFKVNNPMPIPLNTKFQFKFNGNNMIGFIADEKHYIEGNTAAIVTVQDGTIIDPSLKNYEEFSKGGFVLMPVSTKIEFVEEKKKAEVVVAAEPVVAAEAPVVDAEPVVTEATETAEVKVEEEVQTEKPKNINLKMNDLDQKTKVMYTSNKNEIPENQETVTNNLNYVPANQKDNYFEESGTFQVNFNENYRSLDSNLISELGKKLNKAERIAPNDRKSVVNYTYAIENLINRPEDEIYAGNQIINYIEKELKENKFEDLNCKIHKGYVEVTREGKNSFDIISQELIPNLKFFDWQYNKPIQYDTLKHVMAQNITEVTLETNKMQRQEALNILSQEYYIALQPKPEFMMWCLKRLIMIWYADQLLEPMIRKIEILINPFRADPTKDYNKKQGIMPMLVIYPKYGIENARAIIQKLSSYFALYINNDESDLNNIQWDNSNPTYYKRKNSLIHYSNGHIELKQYFKFLMSNKQELQNDVFDSEFQRLISSQNILSI